LDDQSVSMPIYQSETLQTYDKINKIFGNVIPSANTKLINEINKFNFEKDIEPNLNILKELGFNNEHIKTILQKK
jgi:hypothetical protein